MTEISRVAADLLILNERWLSASVFPKRSGCLSIGSEVEPGIGAQWGL